MRVATLAIVGVGLIGGSIALAARRRGIAQRIVGVDRNPQAIEQACDNGSLDSGSADLPAAVADGDLVVFCTPVDCIAAQVVETSGHCKPGSLLTDVGSTKARLIDHIEAHVAPEVAFVGSHPLAGSEKQGALHADADLFAGRVVVVTPTPRTRPDALDRTLDFWRALGATARQLSPAQHDEALALTSHLPHLLAATLAGVLPAQWQELTASGFRDTTRLAAGSPALWSGILRMNSGPIVAALDRFDERLRDFRSALARDDIAAIRALLEQGKEMKDRLR
jgi:prephenate dehydrogenase